MLRTKNDEPALKKENQLCYIFRKYLFSSCVLCTPNKEYCFSLVKVYNVSICYTNKIKSKLKRKVSITWKEFEEKNV